jgi:Uma2 family endonuclease
MNRAMAATVSHVATDQRILLPHVSWATYASLLANADRTVPRMTYDQGALELVTPSMAHEETAHTLTLLIDIVTAIMGIPIRRVGSTTFRREDLQRGFEADASFYIQREPGMRGKREADLSVDPPPDVIVEMEMSRSALNKLALFASMGVPEVWRCDGQRVIILALDGDHYRESAESLAVPVLTGADLTRFLAESRTQLSPDWFQAVSEWARAQRTASD